MARSNLTDKVEGFYIKFMPGMNNKTEDLELAEKFAAIAQNCRFESEPGTVDKRGPVSYFNTASLGTGPVVGAFRFYTSTGTAKWIVAHENKVYVGTDAGGTFTEIRTLANTGKRMSFEVYMDLLIGMNGFDDAFVYDGSSDNITWELGSCKAKIGSGAGITRTNVSYAVTFDNDAVVNGAVSNEIAALTNEDVDLSYIPLGPVGTINRKIYRKDNTTGGAYKLVTTIADNTTTTYTDTTADVSGAAAMPVVTDDMPKGNLPKIHRERLFIAGDPNEPNKIYYSNPYLPHFIQQTTNLDYMEVSPNDGDEIMGIPIQLGRMVCIKKNTIRPLFISSATSGQSPTSWYAEDPIVFSGAAAKWSIVQTTMGVVYLGWDHWYLFNGATSTPIIDEFDTEDILPAAYSDVVAYEHQNSLLAAYADRVIGTQYHNRVMRWNFKRQALSYDTLDVNCFAAKRGDDENGELYYGHSRNGYLLKAVDEDIVYRLSDKTNALLGTRTNVFVGGQENSPYIEIGSDVAALAIPDNICILWDQSDVNPGSGWTEITGMNGRFILINSSVAPGTTGDSVGLSGTAFQQAVALGFRVFKKNNTTTEYQFPDGAIVFWDQVSPPEGFASYGQAGQYLTVATDLESYNMLTGTVNDWVTATDYVVGDFVIESGVTYICSVDHTSGVFATDLTSGYWTAQSGSVGNIENIIELYLIKKIGEAASWEGLAEYVYALYYSAVDPSASGWADVTSSFNGYFAKGKVSDAPESSDGANAASKADHVQLSECERTETLEASAVDQGGNPVEPDSTATDGEQSESYDRDGDTYREYSALHNGDGSVTAEMTWEHTWTKARSISSVYLKAIQGTFGGNFKISQRTFTIYLKINDVWTQIDTSYTADGLGSNAWYYQTRETTVSTGWSNVTGVKVYLKGYAYSYEGTRRQEVKLRLADIRVEGYYGSVAFHLAKKLLGKMQTYNFAIENQETAGTWISPSINVKADSLGRLYWNESLVGSDNALFYFRTGATQALCEAAAWSSAITDPNGVDLSVFVTADAWIQFKVEFSAADTRVSNPRIYYSDGYIVRFTYSQATTYAEESVEFIYDTGFRNLNKPMMDKLFKKLVALFEATQGSMTVSWETENASGSFVIDQSVTQSRWESFFQDNAMGRNIKIRFYKNDLYSLRLKEVQGAYTALPAIL